MYAYKKIDRPSGLELTIGAKTSATGTIFGSVNSIQIAEALEKLGHNVDRKLIDIKEPVKEVGKYNATVRLHKEVTVEILQSRRRGNYGFAGRDKVVAAIAGLHFYNVVLVSHERRREEEKILPFQTLRHQLRGLQRSRIPEEIPLSTLLNFSTASFI